MPIVLRQLLFICCFWHCCWATGRASSL